MTQTEVQAVLESDAPFVDTLVANETVELVDYGGPQLDDKAFTLKPSFIKRPGCQPGERMSGRLPRGQGSLPRNRWTHRCHRQSRRLHNRWTRPYSTSGAKGPSAKAMPQPPQDADAFFDELARRRWSRRRPEPPTMIFRERAKATFGWPACPLQPMRTSSSSRKSHSS